MMDESQPLLMSMTSGSSRRQSRNTSYQTTNHEDLIETLDRTEQSRGSESLTSFGLNVSTEGNFLSLTWRAIQNCLKMYCSFSYRTVHLGEVHTVRPWPFFARSPSQNSRHSSRHVRRIQVRIKIRVIDNLWSAYIKGFVLNFYCKKSGSNF